MKDRRALVLVSLLTCCSLFVGGNAQTPTTLQLGIPIERVLGPGQAHTFTVNLEENNFIQVVVEQRGIDVIVKVFSPAGKSLGEYDSPNGSEGAENVSFVAAAAGTYRITVGPLDPGDVTEGRYQIKILELRPATEQELKANKNQEVVKAKGLALLTEIEGIIPQIRSPQTRIKAQLQAAQLLWESDEKRASRYVSDAVTGLKEFLATIDANNQRYLEQYSAISQLRYEIVQVAARDPDAALSFLYATVPTTDPSGNRREQSTQESTLELSIANQIMRNDPNRALQIARRNLKTGYSANLISTLSQLRRQSPDLAADLANEIASKLLTEKLIKNHEAANLALNLIRFARTPERRVQTASNNGSAVRALLPDDKYRELFQKIITEALSYSQSPAQSSGQERDSAVNLLNGLQSMGAALDTMMTGGAAMVEKKLAELNASTAPHFTVSQQYQNAIANNPVDAALEAIQKAQPEFKEQLYIQLAEREANNGEIARARQIINDHVPNPYRRRQSLTNVAQQEIYRAINNGKVEEALRSISGLPTPRERAALLAQVANQIGPGQKRASALNMLEQARNMLSPSIQAQDQDQMQALFEIARAFARYDSKRAFEIVDPLIDQVNEICAAARTLEGFGPEYYEDEELNLQNGSSVATMAGQMSTVLGTLALTSFDRAKATSDRIRLPEVRLRAYLEIAQQTIQGAK